MVVIDSEDEEEEETGACHGDNHESNDSPRGSPVRIYKRDPRSASNARNASGWVMSENPDNTSRSGELALHFLSGILRPRRGTCLAQAQALLRRQNC